MWGVKALRIIAFSDTHGRYDRVQSLIEATNENCGLYVFLGDNIRDADGIENMFPGIRILKVPGNCDYLSGYPQVAETVVEGKKIVATHGHLHGVKYGMDGIKSLAAQNGADIVFYGHTHCRSEVYSDGVYYVNPGSLSLPKDGKPPSYAIVDILDAGILTAVVDL